MRFSRLAPGIVLIGFCLWMKVRAAPPVDLVSPDPDARPLAPKLSDKDLTFTDPTQTQSDALIGMYEARQTTMGRSMPGRAGKPLRELPAGTKFHFLKYSKDKKWSAVQLLTGRKLWVLNTTIRKIEAETKKKGD